jgi:hypothetical protein
VQETETDHPASGRAEFPGVRRRAIVDWTRVCGQLHVDQGKKDDKPEGGADKFHQSLMDHPGVSFISREMDFVNARRSLCKGSLQRSRTDFSRFEALVRKREALLKSIYERRKGAAKGGRPAMATFLTPALPSSTTSFGKNVARFMPQY